MATAILRPQDCLVDERRHEGVLLTPPSRLRRNRNNNDVNPSPNFNPNTPDSRRRKTSPGARSTKERYIGRNCCTEQSLVAKVPAENLVMEHVKILKRGDVLCAESSNPRAGRNRAYGVKNKEGSNLVLGSTNRLGPDPGMMQRQVRISEFEVKEGFYAGSGVYYASPPPSSVPVPGFLGKNGTTTCNSAVVAA